VRAKIKDAYYIVKGKKKVEINNTNAIFDSRSPRARRKIERCCRREAELLKDLTFSLKRDDVFWDVGANIGVFTCFAMSRISGGKIIAFEPYPPNLKYLKRNVDINNKNTDTLIKHVALSDAVGTAKFTSYKSEDGPSSKSAINPNGEAITVDTYSADDLVQNHGLEPPDVIKIDVEGAEPLVLRGMESTLQNHCRILYCEIHPKESNSEHTIEEYGESIESITKKIERCGFEIEKTTHRYNEVQIKATSN